jgi:pimeloyl-ACP methyl ester carboxylesterase
VQGYDPGVGIEVAVDHRLVTATAADLPVGVVAALADPPAPRRSRTEAAGIDWATVAWGNEADPPVLLVHGVTSEAMNWWRIGPAIATLGRRVVAVDLPGHGETGKWTGRHRHLDTATDLAELITVLGLAGPHLDIVGHSWGGMVIANLPAAGIRPRTLVLVDPPYLSREELEALNEDPIERRYATFEEARAVVSATQPGYAEGDIDAKAMALTRFDVEGLRQILVENGDWRAALEGLADPRAAGIPVWYVLGQWESGGLVRDENVPELAARVGSDHVLTIVGGPHSPMRTHPEATMLAILVALRAVTG